MTKHRDVNKCRQNKKCKRDAQIRQANKRASYERTNKPKIKKEHMVEEKRKKHTKQTTFRKERRGKRNVSEQRDKGWIHVICVHDTTHLAERGNCRSRSKNERSR